MDIESKLIEFYLKKNTKKNDNKTRDLEIITFYYGFKEDNWPTLEDTAEKFDVGTRENVRQLIKKKFLNHIECDDIQPLKEH